jgi:FkbM family methyltransferase
MAIRLKRFVDDLTQSWGAMPKSQALKWYGAVLRRAPTILRERKLYSADHDMHGVVHFKAFGGDFSVDIDAIGSTAGNPYAFCRELFVRQIYFRGFKQLNFTTCLDLGCNAGLVTSVMKQLGGPNARAVGVDVRTYPDNAFRRQAEQLPGVTLIQNLLVGESLRHNPQLLHEMCDPHGLDIHLAITIEEVMDRFDMQKVDFVKMDIEGAEYAIFRDSHAWLNRVDNLAMEVHYRLGDPTEIVQHLQQTGFRVAWADDNGDPVDTRHAAYIYASKTGSLKN